MDGTAQVRLNLVVSGKMCLETVHTIHSSTRAARLNTMEGNEAIFIDLHGVSRIRRMSTSNLEWNRREEMGVRSRPSGKCGRPFMKGVVFKSAAETAGAPSAPAQVSLLMSHRGISRVTGSHCT
jgi:hypothetical protein